MALQRKLRARSTGKQGSPVCLATAWLCHVAEATGNLLARLAADVQVGSEDTRRQKRKDPKPILRTWTNFWR